MSDQGKLTQVLDSKLIMFEPDKWLDNAGRLAPIRTSRKEIKIPSQATFRIIELYRSYVFENWLSVLALARSILEYVILDNLHKFGVSKTYKVTHPAEKEKVKKLNQLIEEVAEHLPQIASDMACIRNYGNEYIHPTKKGTEALFTREKAARECTERLRNVVEALYFADRIKR